MPHAAEQCIPTVEDMYLWDQGLYGDTILSKASRDKMFTPFLVTTAMVGLLLRLLAGR